MVYAGILPRAEVLRDRSECACGSILFLKLFPVLRCASTMIGMRPLMAVRYRRNMLISRKGAHGTEYSVKGYSGVLIRTPVCGF
jgi:hypothetical protein